jgi:hypothetical protein
MLSISSGTQLSSFFHTAYKHPQFNRASQQLRDSRMPFEISIESVPVWRRIWCDARQKWFSSVGTLYSWIADDSGTALACEHRPFFFTDFVEGTPALALFATRTYRPCMSDRTSSVIPITSSRARKYQNILGNPKAIEQDADPFLRVGGHLNSTGVWKVTLM